MRLEDIHVGDRLRIRDWDDMVSEFGLNDSGVIPCVFGFTNMMRSLCGIEFTVQGVVDNRMSSNGGNGVLTTLPTEINTLFGMISADVVEPAVPSPLGVPDPEGLFSLLL